MKRYSFYDSDGHTINEEDKVNCREMPDGEWVKYKDAKDLIDQAWWDAREYEE